MTLTYSYTFPTEDDALVAPHGLTALLDTLDGVQSLEGDVNADDPCQVDVIVTLNTEGEADDDTRIEASLDNWASSTGGY